MLNRALVALVVAAGLNGVAGAPLSALFPVYVEAELHRAPFFSASLRTLLTLLGGLFAIPGGAFCDLIGQRRAFLISLSGGIAAGAVFLTHDSTALFLLCAYAGLMSGFATTGGQSYLMAAAPRERLGLASALYFQSGTMGIALGSFLARDAVDRLGFHFVGQAMMGAALLVLVGALFLMPDVKAGGERRQFALGPLIAGYRRILRQPRVRLLIWLRFLPTYYWGTATLLLPLLIYRLTETKGSAAQYAAISLVVAAACQLLTGRLCDRFGSRWPMRVAIIGVTVSCAMTAVFTHSVVGLTLFGTLGAAFAWSLSTTMPGAIHDIAPEGEKGTVVGITHLAWSAGLLSGTLVAGSLVEWRPGAPFAVATWLCVAACVVAFRLTGLIAPAPAPREAAKRPLARSNSRGV